MSELNDLLTTRELQRWRLILGEAAETTLCGLDGNARQIDHALEWLYGRDPERLQRGERSGGVDQSGSMVDSVIHSAVMAACLWQLPGIRTHLVAFDTSVVDLTADVADPVELLMKVQLGGGTNIASAVEYGRQLIEQPAKSVIILVSDFYEGGSSSLLTHQVKKCVQSGIKVLGLAALDSTATPCYDRDTAQALVNVGAQIAAMTPGELASWLAENLQS